MAEIPQEFWQCSKCHYSVSPQLLVCPNCHTRQPNYQPDQWPALGDGQSGRTNDGKGRLGQTEHFTRQDDQGQHLPPTSLPAGNVEQHHAAVRQRVDQRIEAQRSQTQCLKCKTVLQAITNFCPHCGNSLTVHNSTPSAASITIQVPIQPDQYPAECYFCEQPLNPDNMRCSQCRRPQPDPQGPPCIHGCGVKLISSSVKLCGRCGKPQQVRTPSRPPPDSVISPRSPPVVPEYGTGQGYGSGYEHNTEVYGYGYPNNPTQPISGRVPESQCTQQFGPQASINTQFTMRPPPPPGLPGHAQTGMLDPAESPSTAGVGGNSPIGSRATNLPVTPESGKPESLGHPHSARSTKVEEENKSGDSEKKLETPIQETTQDPHLQDAKNHPLQQADSKESTNGRKRKKGNDSGSSGRSKQNKLDKNDNQNADGTKPLGDSGDDGQAPNSPNNNSATADPADTANKPSITTTVAGSTITTTTAVSTGGTVTTTTANASSSSKEQQVSLTVHSSCEKYQ